MLQDVFSDEFPFDAPFLRMLRRTAEHRGFLGFGITSCPRLSFFWRMRLWCFFFVVGVLMDLWLEGPQGRVVQGLEM